MTAPLDFFRLLYGTATDGYLCLWTLPSKRTHAFHVSELEKAAETALDLDASGSDVYFGVGLRKAAPTQGRGGSKDVLSIPGLWLDLDCAGPGHAASNLPTYDEAFQLIGLLPHAPTVVVDSGGGLHLYYLGVEQLLNPKQKLVEDFQRQFSAAGSAHAMNNWQLDHLHDLARVLRVPGTTNRKIPTNVRPVATLLADGPRYSTYPVASPKFVTLSSHAPQGVEHAPQVAESSALAMIPHGGHPPAPPEPEDSAVFSVLEKLKAVRNKNRDLAQAVAYGRSFAQPGDRDNKLNQVCAMLAFMFPDADPEELSKVLEPSIGAMEDESPDDTFKFAAVLDNAVEKIRRHQATARTKREAEAVISRGVFGSDPNAPSAPAASATPSDPPAEDTRGKYTRADLERFAASQGCTVEQFKHRWIIQRGDMHYVFRDGHYLRPLRSIELSASLEKRDLLKAPIDWFCETEKGVKKIPLMQVVSAHTSVARQVVLDLTIDSSKFDGATEIFYEAPCPRRLIRAQYNPEIHTWLELLGGDEKEKLLDWLATFSNLKWQTSALYLSGSRGTGKTLLANGLAGFWSEGVPTKYENIVNNFNADIVKCPLIFADESVATNYGGKPTSTYLRMLIGSPGLTLSRKYMDNMSVKGNIRMILAANGDELLASIAEENLGAEDLEAIADRILHIRVPPDARAYLEPRKEQIQDWLHGDGIVRHVQWLTETRQVVHGKRFAVTGNAKHAALRRGTTMELVLEWLGRNFETPNSALQRQANALVVGQNQILINCRWIVDNWQVHLPGQRVPRMSLVQKVIKSISHGDVKREGRWYSSIDAEVVLDWMRVHQVGDVDRVRALVLSPTQSPYGTLPC